MTTVSAPAPTPLHAPPLLLRPWQDDDAPALYEAIRESIESVGRFMPWCHPDYRLEEAQAWTAHCRASWLEGSMHDFAILTTEGRLLGAVGLNQLDYRNFRANLGYWIRDSARGQGYTALAARTVAAFGFGSLALQRIEIVAAVDNLASQRCAEKIGGQREGIARRRIWMHNEAHNAVVYGLVPDDLVQPAAAHQRTISS